MNVNYFELYEIPANLHIDASALRKRYFALSRQYHPDQFMHAAEEKQEEMLLISSEVNKAYNILKDLPLRMHYLLTLNGVIGEEKEQLDPMFLMEMMDINESLFELEGNPDVDKITSIKNEIASISNNLNSPIQYILDQKDTDLTDTADLEKIKGFYFKMKYIMRIQKKLITFAIQ